MNFSQILKKSIVLILFSVFLACSIIALKELLARKIGNSVSFETRKAISLPSWTLCPHILRGVYNVSNAHEFTKLLAELPINLTIHHHGPDGENEGSFNMTDANILKQHFNVTMEETWNVHCKVNQFGSGCDPSLTFNAPQKGVGKFNAFLKITQENPKQDTMILLFHDPDSSLALSSEYNWNQVLYFVIKQGRT